MHFLLSKNYYFSIKGGKMTIKKFVLSATVVSVFALTVPVSFAACPLNNDCGCPDTCVEKVTPENAVCKKCNQTPCKCKKEKKKKHKCDPCETGAAAPAPDCGCEVQKDDCGCTTGAAAPSCVQAAQPKAQVYAYPNSIYSNANEAVVGESSNTAAINDNMLEAYNGVMVDDSCPTGCAAPIVPDMVQTDCCPAPNVSSPTSMDAKKIIKEEIPNITGMAADIGEQHYPDVPNSYWASDDINRLTDQCIVVGYPDRYFKPNKDVSRAEMATMVVKGYNLEDQCLTDAGNFPDVPRSHWAYEAINKGVGADMIEGYENGLFKPNGSITRTEALAILSKGINCPMDNCKADEILSKYTDGNQVPAWARECVAKAIDNGALKDEASSKIRPNQKATRAEISSMLQGVRVAGGYDTDVKTACEPCEKTEKMFVEKEECIKIPTLELSMNDIINAKNANVGEQFAATTLNEITINGTTFPCGSTVRGKITEVVRPSKGNGGALKLSFNQISYGDCKEMLPKQVHTAMVQKQKDVNFMVRAIQFPFTMVGTVLGTAGRTVGGAAIGLANATEALFDQAGVGTGELFSGKFKAAGRSYQDGLKTAFKAPVDLTRTALSGTLGTLQTSADELTYLVDPNGMAISRVNPKEKVTIAFGE